MHGDVQGNARRAQEALKFLEGQRQADLQPNLFSYNCALASCSKSPEDDAAIRAIGIFQRLLKRGDASNPIPSLLINSCWRFRGRPWQKLEKHGTKMVVEHGKVIRDGSLT